MNAGEVGARISLRSIARYLAIAGILSGAMATRGEAGGNTNRRMLYVLDTNRGAVDGQVVLIDASTGKIDRTYATGYRPDMALSLDGSRLYISSRRGNGVNSSKSMLEVYDTASGTMIDAVDNPDSFQTTTTIYKSRMAISSSGRYIYMLKLHNARDGTDEYIAAFDTLQRRFLRDHISLNTECDFVMLPTSEELTLDVACADSSNLREMTLSDGTAPVKDRILPIKTNGPKEKWGAVFLQPGERNVALVSASGSAFAVERVSAAAQRLGTAAQSGPWIQRGLMTESRSEVYFSTGTGHRSYPDGQDTIVGVDQMTLSLQRSLRTAHPFFSMELSRDGNTLYAVDPEQAAITVVDAASFREVTRLVPIGHTPCFAIAAP